MKKWPTRLMEGRDLVAMGHMLLAMAIGIVLFFTIVVNPRLLAPAIHNRAEVDAIFRDVAQTYYNGQARKQIVAMEAEIRKLRGSLEICKGSMYQDFKDMVGDGG